MNSKKITRAILGITIAFSATSFATENNEASATAQIPATKEKAEQPHGY